jgi:hypothetical protein
MNEMTKQSHPLAVDVGTEHCSVHNFVCHSDPELVEEVNVGAEHASPTATFGLPQGVIIYSFPLEPVLRNYVKKVLSINCSLLIIKRN